MKYLKFSIVFSDSTAKMRCRLRKQLFIKRNKICEISLAFGLAGLIFIIIDSEITATSVDNDFSKVNNSFKFLNLKTFFF